MSLRVELSDLKTSIEARFWAKVDKRTAGGCWEWNGSRKARGYGQINAGGRGGAMLKAHRVSWAIHFGSIPDGLHVLHRCDNPPCVNPDHLFLGTNKDNASDCKSKGRKASLAGEQNGRAKLNCGAVLAIRALASEGVSRDEIKDRFAISRTTVREIIERKKWSHV
jgi:hypothetical protein